MSLKPGATIRKDPSAKKVYTFKWSSWLISPALIASYTITIAGNDAGLTYDNDAIVDVDATDDGVQVRLVGGTPGLRYAVTCHIITNETPAQEDDATLYVQIQDQ